MLVKPIITEKSMKGVAMGQYAFRVVTGAKKPEIKNAVETTFGVNVVGIQTLYAPGKTRRAGKRGQIKQLSDWKKAIVSLKPGQKIDLFEVPEAK